MRAGIPRSPVATTIQYKALLCHESSKLVDDHFHRQDATPTTSKKPKYLGKFTPLGTSCANSDSPSSCMTLSCNRCCNVLLHKDAERGYYRLYYDRVSNTNLRDNFHQQLPNQFVHIPCPCWGTSTRSKASGMLGIDPQTGTPSLKPIICTLPTSRVDPSSVDTCPVVLTVTRPTEASSLTVRIAKGRSMLSGYSYKCPKGAFTILDQGGNVASSR